MTTRLNARIHTACLAMLLMLAPVTAFPAEQKEQPAQPEKTAVEPATQGSGSLTPPAVPAASATQREAAQQPETTAAAAAPAAGRGDLADYTIKPGDTLWDIANAFFHDPYLWPLIWQANPSIEDPDLILAGNKLAVPDMTPVERAMQSSPQTAAATQPIEKQTTAREEQPAAPSEKAAPQPVAVAEQAAPSEATPEPKSLSGIASARATRPRSAKAAALAVESTSPGSMLILPEEQQETMIDKYTMLSAGFVNSVDGTDHIVEPVETGKVELAYDDLVYVKVASRDSVNVGDKFLVYRPLDAVRHPRTNEHFGRLIRGLGVLQITAKDPSADVLIGRITLSFDTMQPGSLLTPYQEPALLYASSAKKAKDITGYVLEVQDWRTITGQTDVVYLDKGSQDGVDVGDRFTVYADQERKGNPRKAIGEVLVFLVKERSSTAVVRRSSNIITTGNAFSFKP